jgi:hypothetical protein
MNALVTAIAKSKLALNGRICGLRDTVCPQAGDTSCQENGHLIKAVLHSHGCWGALVDFLHW